MTSKLNLLNNFRIVLCQTSHPGNIGSAARAMKTMGLSQLYFLYEASDDYWDFSRSDLHNDIFEVVVDGRAAEDFFAAAQFFAGELDNYREHFDDEDRTDRDQEEYLVGHQCNDAEHAPQS